MAGCVGVFEVTILFLCVGVLGRFVLMNGGELALGQRSERERWLG